MLKDQLFGTSRLLRKTAPWHVSTIPLQYVNSLVKFFMRDAALEDEHFFFSR